MTPMVTCLLVLIGFAIFLHVGLRLGSQAADRRIEHADRRQRRDAVAWDERSPASRWIATARHAFAHRAALPLLPEGHRPPPGLGPISPSERFLSAETARGLRELQLFLLDPA